MLRSFVLAVVLVHLLASAASAASVAGEQQSIVATDDGGLVVTDDFSSLDVQIWNKTSYDACNSCLYASCRYDNNGTLFINGDSSCAMMSMAGSWTFISNIAFVIKKINVCSDHFLKISEYSVLSSDYEDFSFYRQPGSTTFAWNCNTKRIYTSSNNDDDDAYTYNYGSTSQYCSLYATYSVNVTISTKQVSFSDDLCGTMTASDSIGSSNKPLFVYIGSDSDLYNTGYTYYYNTPVPTPVPMYDDGQWKGIQVTGFSDDFISTAPPTVSPIPTVSPAPTSVPTLAPTDILSTGTMLQILLAWAGILAFGVLSGALLYAGFRIGCCHREKTDINDVILKMNHKFELYSTKFKAEAAEESNVPGRRASALEENEGFAEAIADAKRMTARDDEVTVTVLSFSWSSNNIYKGVEWALMIVLTSCTFSLQGNCSYGFCQVQASVSWLISFILVAIPRLPTDLFVPNPVAPVKHPASEYQPKAAAELFATREYSNWKGKRVYKMPARKDFRSKEKLVDAAEEQKNAYDLRMYTIGLNKLGKLKGPPFEYQGMHEPGTQPNLLEFFDWEELLKKGQDTENAQVTKFNKKKCEEHEAKEAKKREQNMKALERFRNQQEVHSRRLDAFDDMQSALYQLFVFLSIIWFFVGASNAALCGGSSAYTCPSISVPTFVIQFTLVVKRKRRLCFKENIRFSVHKENIALN